MFDPTFRRTLTQTVCIAALVLAPTTLALASEPTDLLEARSAVSRGPSALAISNFVGPPTSDPFQPVTGWNNGAIYTQPRGNGVVATEDGIALRRNGVYRVHLEGVLFHTQGDATADPGSGMLFSVNADDVYTSCMTQERRNADTLPAAWAGPGFEQISQCTVDFTLEVRGAESNTAGFPATFARGTVVQVTMWPNDLPLGDGTNALARIEVQRIGN